MPIADINSQHFTESATTQLDTALDTFEGQLKDYVRNLSPAERQKYGSIQEKNKLFVNKVLDYHTNHPTLDCPDVDWTEFDADVQDRKQAEAFIQRLDGLIMDLSTIKIMHDYDNYKAALMDYRFAGYKITTPGGAAWRTKYDELRQFFNRSNNGEDEDEGSDEGGNGQETSPAG